MENRELREKQIKNLFLSLTGEVCEDKILERLIRNRFSIEKIKASLLKLDKYTLNRNIITNFDSWIEFGKKYTHVLRDRVFREPLEKSDYNLVFIDFRYLDNMEFVIRNALLKINGLFCVTFICGQSNYIEVNELCSSISPKIKVVKIDACVTSQKSYNRLLLKPGFWKNIEGKKILLHQFDAFILKKGVEPFLTHDYLGSPCYNFNEELILNGGFSYRDKYKMIELLEKFKPSKIFEDMFFSRNINTDKDACELFSFQNEERDSFGCHQFWRAKQYSFTEMYQKTIHKINNKKIIIIHCGNLEILEEICIKFPQIKLNKLLITYYKEDYKDILYEKFKTNALHIMKVKNKGCDCGPFLLCLKYLLENQELYDQNTIFLKIHTKSITEWRDRLIEDIIQINDILEDVPVIIGSDKYAYDNNKLVNYEYVYNIIGRNEKNKVSHISDFLDIYHNDKVNKSSRNNIFQDLDFNLKFYKNYEPDLRWVKNRDHWEIYGKNEFHRISNVNYIKSFSKVYNKFIAGTIFGFNKKFLDLFNSYDLTHEYQLLEDGYVKNNIITKTHTWEYIFSIVNSINDGVLLTFTNSVEKRSFDKNSIKPPIKPVSAINVPFLSSKKAIFLLIPGDNPDSGGYRTLLKNISNFNKLESVDLYFGVCWNDSEVLENVTKEDDLGVPECRNWRKNITLNKILSRISKYNEIDIEKNNFYLGFKCQRNYESIYANAWQTAEAVYLNKDKAKKKLYIIFKTEKNYFIQTM